MALLFEMVPFPGCATINNRFIPHHQGLGKLRKVGYVPALNEIFEVFAPLDPILLLILQLRNRLSHYISKQINQSRLRLHFRAIGGEREAVLSHFQKCDTEGPDVGGDGVRFTSDALRGHIVRGADEGIGIPFGAKFTANAEVAQADLTGAGQEDVGRFDV